METRLLETILSNLRLFWGIRGLNQGLICNVVTHKMFLCRLLGPGIQICDQFIFSHSRAPLCNLENSFGTPLGLHLVCEKIGEGIPVNGEFIARKFTGQIIPIARSEKEKARITTRILRLQGMQLGINRGVDLGTHRSCDTYQRCVYIHGTNLESFIPKALSQGCLCLNTQDLLRLFKSINVGDFCFIV